MSLSTAWKIYYRVAKALNKHGIQCAHIDKVKWRERTENYKAGVMEFNKAPQKATKWHLNTWVYLISDNTQLLHFIYPLAINDKKRDEHNISVFQNKFRESTKREKFCRYLLDWVDEWHELDNLFSYTPDWSNLFHVVLGMKPEDDLTYSIIDFTEDKLQRMLDKIQNSSSRPLSFSLRIDIKDFEPNSNQLSTLLESFVLKTIPIFHYLHSDSKI